MAGIQHIKRNDLNVQKWDACIDAASNGLIYAYSFYLDALCDNWDALVMGDYEAVMPLPWRKKWGIKYVYQPFLVAQLGVFAKVISPQLMQQFIKAIPKSFSYIDYMLNSENTFLDNTNNIKLRSNYTLKLNSAYTALYNNYNTNLKRNIKKAFTKGCFIEKSNRLKDVITLVEQQGNIFASKRDFRRFETLFSLLAAEKKAVVYSALSPSYNTLSAAAFLIHENRAYYILAGNHPSGKNMGASHALIDAFIKDHSSQNLVLDFEGSDIKTLALFYKSFGALEEKYGALKINRLPWPIRWLKK